MKEKYKAKIAVFVTLISQFCLLNKSVIYVNIRTVSKYCVLLFKCFHNFNLGGLWVKILDSCKNNKI